MELFDIKNDAYLENTSFHHKTMIHDWRNYVPDEIISLWKTLSHRERQLVYFTTEKQSKEEYWD